MELCNLLLLSIPFSQISLTLGLLSVACWCCEEETSRYATRSRDTEILNSMSEFGSIICFDVSPSHMVRRVEQQLPLSEEKEFWISLHLTFPNHTICVYKHSLSFIHGFKIYFRLFHTLLQYPLHSQDQEESSLITACTSPYQSCLRRMMKC